MSNPWTSQYWLTLVSFYQYVVLTASPVLISQQATGFNLHVPPCFEIVQNDAFFVFTESRDFYSEYKPPCWQPTELTAHKLL